MKRVNLQMKSATMVLWIIFCVVNMNTIHAQTIIDDLQSQTNDSDGVIRIDCNPSIAALIGKPNKQLATNGNADFIERNGFRIQVFMGNGNDPQARPEANSKQSAIRDAFPDLSTHMRYEAPNWKLLVGDFMTREEANIVLRQLQKEFPLFGKEMYIVQEKIKLFIQH